MEESIKLYTEAYRLHLDAGDQRERRARAPCCSPSTPGWSVRPRRARAGSAAPSGCSSGFPRCAAHGYPLYLGTAGLTWARTWTPPRRPRRRMQDLGRRHDDPTLVALGVYFEGRVRIKQARVAEGLALLDEAMVAALSDDLDAALDRARSTAA